MLAERDGHIVNGAHRGKQTVECRHQLLFWSRLLIVHPWIDDKTKSHPRPLQGPEWLPCRLLSFSSEGVAK
ncbi:MAG: hypothetical protein WBB98_00430 [Xanthobacteraceae bacterium]